MQYCQPPTFKCWMSDFQQVKKNFLEQRSHHKMPSAMISDEGTVCNTLCIIVACIIVVCIKQRWSYTLSFVLWTLSSSNECGTFREPRAGAHLKSNHLGQKPICLPISAKTLLPVKSGLKIEPPTWVEQTISM